MNRVTARVVCLPSPADMREEAGRLGVEPVVLEGFAGGFGAEIVKLSGVAPQVAAALPGMISPPAGLVVMYRKSPEEIAQNSPLPLGEGQGDGVPGGGSVARAGRAAGPYRVENSEGVSILLAGAAPLLVDAASRLESSGGEAKAAGEQLRTTLERYHGRQLGATGAGSLALEWGRRTYVMGIINVTPDSFSGDGLGPNVDAAVAQALRFVEEGADILDVGGESTRPGSETVSDEEEIARVVPVIERLAKAVTMPISVDSCKVEVARRALDAGASIVNDIWGLRHDPDLANLAADRGVPIILMHNRRALASRTELGGHFRQVEYHDLMGDIVDGLRESVEIALERGVSWENVIVDPGIGFGKTPAHNLVVMRRLRELKSLGRPILMGTSRKSVIGLTLGVPMGDRVEGTGATVAVSICNGADIVRVHDVKEMVRVSRMTDAIVRPASSV